VSVFLGFSTALGATGLWYGFVVSLGVVAVFLVLRIRVLFGGRDLRRVELTGWSRGGRLARDSLDHVAGEGEPGLRIATHDLPRRARNAEVIDEKRVHLLATVAAVPEAVRFQGTSISHSR